MFNYYLIPSQPLGSSSPLRYIKFRLFRPSKSKSMSMSMNGESRVPPGFRFHPTEEELLNYYLRKKVASAVIDLDVIRDVDLNKLEPWDIQDKCRIGSTPQNDWYFFSHKDKKYPTGTRTNRATAAGFWKATGRDKVIYTSLKRLGMRKTLVFYKGRAPHGQKSDWIMHEYRLQEHLQDDNNNNIISPQSNASVGEIMQGQEDGWVVCRVFKKKNYHKSLNALTKSSSNRNEGKIHEFFHSGDVDQILRFIGKSCLPESSSITTYNNFENSNCSTTTTTTNNATYLKYLFPTEICASSAKNELLENFNKLPALQSPSTFSNVCPPQLDQPTYNDPIPDGEQLECEANPFQQQLQQTDPNLHDWGTLDHLVASHLNGQLDVSKQLLCFDDADNCYEPFCSSTPTEMSNHPPEDYIHGGGAAGDMDLWGPFTSGSVSSSG